jgi:hypothetical protein
MSAFNAALRRHMTLSLALALVAGLSFASASGGVHAAEAAAPFDLVTESEAKVDAAAPRAPRTRSVKVTPPPGSPAIQVLAPSLSGGAIGSPLRIAVTFKAVPGARILPGTFRVMYGVLKIDLTERVSKYATVNEEGAVIDQAKVPSGQHRLLLRVADDKGNLGEQELLFRVEPQ